MKSFKCAALFVMGVSLSGCYSLSGNVQARSELPSSSQVAGVDIAYDPSQPRYIVVVEPFSDGRSVMVETNTTGSHYCNSGHCATTTVASSRGTAVAAQLISALSNVPNIIVVDGSAAGSRKALKEIRARRGEVGPYLVRGTLTELTENAEGSSRERQISLGWVGVVAGIAGAVTGNSALGWSGAGVAAANPTFTTAKAVKTGMVNFDIQLVDPSSQRIIRSFQSAGTFTSESVLNGGSLFGIGGSNAEFQQSVLGQAMRAAMNNATRDLLGALRYAPRPVASSRAAKRKVSEAQAVKTPKVSVPATAPQQGVSPLPQQRQVDVQEL